MNRFVLVFLAASWWSLTAACPFSGAIPPQDIDITDEAIHCPHALEAALEASPDVTAKGCICSSKCGASVDLSGAKCDWCYTQNSCGHSGLKGYWDYCVYPPLVDYEKQTWSQKQDALWAQIIKDQRSGVYPSPLGLFTESIRTSFWNNKDVMPAGRKKYIHSVGSVCKITFRNDDTTSGYTGLFEPGVIQHGFIRLGSAAAVTKSSGITPGLGIKFLRTGVQSGNYVALVKLDPQEDNNYNFLKHNFSNHLPPAGSKASRLIAGKFEQASGCPTQVGLSDMSMFDINGQKVANPKFPFRLEMFSSEIQLDPTPTDQAGMQERIVSGIPPNSMLFDISAYDSPQHYKSGKAPRHLGQMYTEGDCVNSAFGDSSLFFRHQLIEQDWALQPEWVKDLDPKTDCSASTISLTPPAGCEGADLAKEAPIMLS